MTTMIPMSTQFKACTQLLGECGEMWDNPPAWQEHFTAGIEHIVGGYGSVFSVNAISVDGIKTNEACTARANGALAQHVFKQFLEDGGINLMPSTPQVLAHLPRNGYFTWNEHALGGRKALHGSELYQRYLRQLDADDVLFHAVFTSPEKIICVGLLRDQRDPAYGAREHGLIAFLGDAIAERSAVSLQFNSQTGRHRLSPRQQETLDYLINGLSEKEIAREMSLNPRTVHDYVTSIYKKFGFHSRAQLMAAYIQRRFPAKPS